MEITYTLIVALMYVTILSFGLASLLTSLGMILRSDNDIKVSYIQLNWILILLIVHFNMVWHAVFFTNIESWSYHAFLAIVLGPTLAFFTATILAPSPSGSEDIHRLISDYFSTSRQLILLFGAIQVWAIASDFLLERGPTGSAMFNILLLLVSAVLFGSGSEKTHTYGIYIIWTIYITSIIFRSLSFIQ